MKQTANYPDPLDTWENKKKDAYGLSFAKSIGIDWFAGGTITTNCEFSRRQLRIRENRLYTRGEQDDKKSKHLFQRQDGDLSMINLDWRIINHVGKFCNIVSNGINDDYYTIDIVANDRLTLKVKKEKRDKHLENMRSMPLLKMAKEELGVDMMPKGFVPRDEEELNIYEQMNEKPQIEIAEGIIIDYIKKVNRYKSIEKSKNKELTNNGIAAAKIDTCSTNGITIKEIDAEYLVHSFVRVNDFSDATYYGYVDTISIGEIAQESNYEEKDLRKIASLYSKKNKYSRNFATCNIDDLLSFQIDVLRFSFETSKTEVYKNKKRNGKTVKITKKDENYNPPQRNDYGKLSSVKNTWMEGTYVIGTDYLYNYKEIENIIRDEQDKAASNFIVRATDIYENRLHSFLDDIKPLADELQNIHLKIQHLRSELKPDLIEIDEDVLAEVDETTNKKTFFNEALNILNVKGVVIKKRIDMGEMGVKEGSPARSIATPQGGAIAHLLNLYAHYYNQIRDVTGINPAADGSLPHDALLGVSQMAKLSANTATAHIVDAAIDFNLRVAEVISSRVHAIFRNPNAKHLQKLYTRAVGKRNIDALEPLKDRHLHDFGFTVEMIPTNQAVQDFKEDLSLYLQQGLISPEIKSEATRIGKTSLKLASQYLAYMSKKRQQEMAQQQQQTMQMKTQSDVAAAKQASEGRIQEEGIKTKMKLQYETAMSNIRVAERKAMLEIEAPSKDVEFQQDVYLEKIKSMTNIDMAKFKETAKDERLKKASTHQSELINQRKKGNEPIDFETNFDFGNDIMS